ncbi:Piwi domain-containing protein [Trametes gibbosa]|nr:Piwi domain-containing protein [Trametes gibbosa]
MAATGRDEQRTRADRRWQPYARLGQARGAGAAGDGLGLKLKVHAHDASQSESDASRSDSTHSPAHPAHPRPPHTRSLHPPPHTSAPAPLSNAMNQITVYTNSYEIVRLPTTIYYHYDEINPEGLIKRRNYEVIDQLQLANADIFNPRAVYDGRKNLFCIRDIPPGRFTVSLGRVKPKSFEIKIKRSPDDPSDNSMALNLLQLIVRQAPNMRHNFPADARSFYIAHNSKMIGNGLSAWRGYFQSVRPVLGKLIINVDVSHAAVYTPGRLIDTMTAFLGARDIRQLVMHRTNDEKYGRLRRFLKGVVIKVTLTDARPRRISDIVLQAGLQEFDKGNERCTVVQHFESKYNCRVRYPEIVGIRTGSSAIIPAEFCDVVPGQVFRKKMSPAVQNEFLRFSTQKPNERLRDIQNAVGGQGQLFDYGTSDFVRASGMAISTQAISIPGLVLAPPTIRYGNGDMTIAHKAGSWNVVGKRFVQPSSLRFWGVAVFDNEKSNEVWKFVAKLIGNLEKAGLRIVNREPPIVIGNPLDPARTLEDCAKRCLNPQYAAQGQTRLYPQLILVVLPANGEGCRRMVKHWGDIQRQVSTQCVRTPKWHNASDQYCNNVALKINSRLGGTNSLLVTRAAEFLKTCMVVGADVGHPGPGMASRPSVTGLVASVDPDITKMTSYANIQRPRQEIIEDLEAMMISALSDYQEYHKADPRPPKTVVFYRDGVSEGEFAQVAAREIPLIKSAFDKCHIPKALTPKLLFIVVGKRHHVRFFPQAQQDADRSGNCPAGLLIDKNITNPNYPDFYLQAHAGLLGTSRPAHYIVLANEAKLDASNVQELTYHLCHSYASATRSVSIPAPVYYADRICARMEFHCAEGTAGLSDTASNVTGQGDEFNLEYWKAAFKQSGLNKRMYFI